MSSYYSGNHLVPPQLPTHRASAGPRATPPSSRSTVAQPALPCHCDMEILLGFSPSEPSKLQSRDLQPSKVTQFHPPP
ncbi:hypothetical protein QQF64_026567 [Cirrhinus molitorella]|uniref:Uncharacterized protein n=1 Tax=Cirrhinus molitorella TaxID=172907 RepID=A0ABR3N9X0_9TELE